MVVSERCCIDWRALSAIIDAFEAPPLSSKLNMRVKAFQGAQHHVSVARCAQAC